MSSLEFILGMEKEKEMQRKQREDELKELDKKQKAERLLQLKNEKDKKIDEIKQEEIK